MQTNVSNKLYAELKTIRQEIDSLKTKLKEIIKNREEWFLKKEQLKKNLSTLVNKLRKIKKEKILSDSKFLELKKQRDNYNNQVKSFIQQIKELKLNNPISKNLKIRTPEKIKEIIEKLELDIETGAISFKKEKELMEKIKKLKKEYKDNLELFKNSIKINDFSKKIDEARKKSQEFHKKLQDQLKEQKDYNIFILLSKEILNTRKNQEEAFNTFIKFKNDFKTLAKLLRAKQKQFNIIKLKLLELKKQKELEKEKQANKKLEEKRKMIDEKLKSGKRITTEDLLLYQDKK